MRRQQKPLFHSLGSQPFRHAVAKLRSVYFSRVMPILLPWDVRCAQTAALEEKKPSTGKFAKLLNSP